MNESQFINDFKNGDLPIYICVSKDYNGSITFLNTLKRKLNDNEIGIVAWLVKDKAEAALFELGLQKENWKVVQIYGDDYKTFLYTFDEDQRKKIRISIDLND
jgi:hypothetical protein